MEKYKVLVKECEDFKATFSAGKNLDDFTIGEIKELKSKAQSIMSRIDRVVSAELYRPLGMGNLTILQQNQLCALVKKMASTRSYLKPIQNANVHIDNIPDVSDYKCTVAGVKLKAEIK